MAAVRFSVWMVSWHSFDFPDVSFSVIDWFSVWGVHLLASSKYLRQVSADFG
jgi:hypothetical protein